MKGKNIARIVIATLSILFVALYFTQTTGYYEFEQRKKTTLTEEQIRQFEQDVAEGKKIDLENYLESGKKNYNNKISSLSLSLSKKIEDLFNSGMEYLFKSIEKTVNDR